jgi:hypothetical protein
VAGQNRLGRPLRQGLGALSFASLKGKLGDGLLEKAYDVRFTNVESLCKPVLKIKVLFLFGDTSHTEQTDGNPK